MRISGVLSFVLLLAIVGAAMVTGGSGAFLSAPALLICVGVTGLLGVLSFGSRALWAGLSSVWLLFVSGSSHGPSPLKAGVLRGLIVHAYASAALGVLIGLIQMLRAVGPGPDSAVMLMRGTAVLLLCPLYAVLLAELLFRPALHLVKAVNETDSVVERRGTPEQGQDSKEPAA